MSTKSRPDPREKTPRHTPDEKRSIREFKKDAKARARKARYN